MSLGPQKYMNLTHSAQDRASWIKSVGIRRNRLKPDLIISSAVTHRNKPDENGDLTNRNISFLNKIPTDIPIIIPSIPSIPYPPLIRPQGEAQSVPHLCKAFQTFQRLLAGQASLRWSRRRSGNRVVSKVMGVAPNHPLVVAMSSMKHLFWGTPMTMETPI